VREQHAIYVCSLSE